MIEPATFQSFLVMIKTVNHIFLLHWLPKWKYTDIKVEFPSTLGVLF